VSSREDLAKAARLSSNQVVTIEKIQKQATPELVAAIKSGKISLNAAAAVATLSEDEQKAAVIAGKDELKQAAKRVRDAKRKPREEDSSSQAATDPDELQMLRQRVDELTVENEILRRQISELQNHSTVKQVPW
jgi:predicted RNase H-like nuclease (RuvC/YqgF family)